MAVGMLKGGVARKLVTILILKPEQKKSHEKLVEIKAQS
jgi:hypothetical protein